MKRNKLFFLIALLTVSLCCISLFTACGSSNTNPDFKMEYSTYGTDGGYFYTEIKVMNLSDKAIPLKCSDFKAKIDGKEYVSSNFITGYTYSAINDEETYEAITSVTVERDNLFRLAWGLLKGIKSPAENHYI